MTQTHAHKHKVQHTWQRRRLSGNSKVGVTMWVNRSTTSKEFAVERLGWTVSHNSEDAMRRVFLQLCQTSIFLQRLLMNLNVGL